MFPFQVSRFISQVGGKKCRLVPSALSVGTGFPLQVVKDQIKVLISGIHGCRLWPLPLCAQLLVM